MRRGWAVVLVVLLGLWPLVGLTGASEDLRLPPCCRRHGAHHCAMMLAAMARLKPAKKPVLEAPATCSSYPRTMNGASAPTAALAASGLRTAALVWAGDGVARRSEEALPGKLLLHAGRGPPAFLQS